MPSENRTNGRNIMSFCFLLIGLYVTFSALKWPPRTGLFPLIMGMIFTALFAVELILSLFYKKWKEEKRTGFDFKFAEGIDKSKVKRRSIEAFASILAYFVLILAIGFVYAIPVFFFLYFRFIGREGWKKSILITAAGWVIFYMIFIWGMKNSYPESWLYQLSAALGIVK